MSGLFKEGGHFSQL